MAQLVECTEYTYYDGMENDPDGLIFRRERQYTVLGHKQYSGYLVVNEFGENHYIGVEGDTWFDRYFKIIY